MVVQAVETGLVLVNDGFLGGMFTSEDFLRRDKEGSERQVSGEERTNMKGGTYERIKYVALLD